VNSREEKSLWISLFGTISLASSDIKAGDSSLKQFLIIQKTGFFISVLLFGFVFLL